MSISEIKDRIKEDKNIESNLHNEFEEKFRANMRNNVRREILTAMLGELDELEFTNLLRKHNCTAVNDVQDEIKDSIKAKIQDALSLIDAEGKA